MRVYKTKENVFAIHVNEDNTLSVTYIARVIPIYSKWVRTKETPYKHTNLLIMQAGSVEALLSKSIEVNNINDYLANLNVEREAELRGDVEKKSQCKEGCNVTIKGSAQ